MLARSLRIPKKDLSRVFQKGKKVREGYLLVRTISNHFSHPRFAIIISKKVAPKAVDRNRLKRKTTEILAAEQNQLNHLDIVITYQKLPQSEAEIESNIIKALSPFMEKR